MRNDPAGLHLVGFHHRRLDHAIDLLDGLPLVDRQAMKVRAGEPLAAILLTAVFLAAPSEVDSDGGVDLSFQVEKDRTFGLFPEGRQVVEVKSVGSSFREYEAVAERGGLLVPDGFQVVIESADAVLAAVSPLVARAARKTADEEADARHAFVIVHPFERLAAEVFTPLIGAQLGPVNLPEPLDALWIAWHPSQLTVWSRAMSRWTQVVFNAKNEHEEDDDEEPLQAAERRFLDRLPGSGASPFQYRLDDAGVPATTGVDANPGAVP